MFQNRYLFILYFLLGILYSQPKLSLGIDIGYYKPIILLSSESEHPIPTGFSKDFLPLLLGSIDILLTLQWMGLLVLQIMLPLK